ncbi:MAG: hypothetical protein V3V02_07240 [Rhizobiaceae bacterium]
MSKTNASSGGSVEKAIWFLAGNIMALIGVVMAYMCYTWAVEPKSIEYRSIWVAGSGSLAWFLLRGAWFTIFPPEAKPERFTTREG